MSISSLLQTCSSDLRNVAVYCKDGQLYCEKDYKANFVPKCAKCMEYILEVSAKSVLSCMKIGLITQSL